MPEEQIISAWYSNKMSINRLSAPNSNICLIRLCAWSNFILLLSASCQSSPGPKDFFISSILFSFYPYSALMFHALLLKSKTQIQESICKKIIHAMHTSYLSREPRVYPCKFFLAGVNFYRFNAKNWHFRQILREKVAFFTDLTRKIGVFRCKFYSPKILPV